MLFLIVRFCVELLRSWAWHIFNIFSFVYTRYIYLRLAGRIWKKLYGEYYARQKFTTDGEDTRKSEVDERERWWWCVRQDPTRIMDRVSAFSFLLPTPLFCCAREATQKERARYCSVYTSERERVCVCVPFSISRDILCVLCVCIPTQRYTQSWISSFSSLNPSKSAISSSHSTILLWPQDGWFCLCIHHADRRYYYEQQQQ